jgi:hypothetical protein
MSSLLNILIMLLIMFFIPVLLIYGIFKSILDAFKWKFLRKTYYLIPLMLIAQTTSNLIDTLSGMLISIFYIILPAFFILLILKAFTKLVRV